MADELVEIVDDAGQTLQAILRSVARKEQLRYRVALVAAFDGDLLLIHQRTLDAFTMAGMWDVAAGGAVNPGEIPEVAAARELQEELGVQAEEMVSLGASCWDGETHTYVHCYATTYTGFVLPDPHEVHAVRLVNRAQLEQLGETAELCPDSKALILPAILNRIASGRRDR